MKAFLPPPKALWIDIPHLGISNVQTRSFGAFTGIAHQPDILQQNPFARVTLAAIEIYGHLGRACPFYILVHHITHLDRRYLHWSHRWYGSTRTAVRAFPMSKGTFGETFYLLWTCSILVTVVLIYDYRIAHVPHRNVLKNDVFCVARSSLYKNKQ